MQWFSAIYFFVVTLSTGTLIDLFVDEWQTDWLEKLIIRFGVGLAALSVEGVILNLMHIPLDYLVFLAIGISILLGALLKNKPFFCIKTDKFLPALTHCWKSKTFWYAIFMLALFAITVIMYESGTFKYTYFEDTDPWGYTAVAHYIGEAKTFSAPYYSLQYNEPYTQGYQIVMGVLSQTNDSIYWTMKFFSALIISFGILFMYYFARRFSGNEEIALLAGFFLFAVPAWVSHFLFSLHYNMTIFVVLLYVLAQLLGCPNRHVTESRIPGAPPATLLAKRIQPGGRSDGWVYIGILVYASMLINHFTSVLHASIFCFAYIVTRILAERKIDWQTIMVFPGGFLLSLLFFIPAWGRHWWLTAAKPPPGGIGGVEKLSPIIRFVVTPPGIMAVIIVLTVIISIYWSRRYWQHAIEGWLEAGHRSLIIWLSCLLLLLLVLLQPLKISQILGTADRFYTVRDFFSASATNMINNPVGLGFVLMFAVVVSFLMASAQIKKYFTPGNSPIAVGYAWIITAFLLVLGKYFSIALMPFRVWTFLGFFASLFAAWGIVSGIRSLSQNFWILGGVMVVLIAVVIPTSFVPKFQLNTSVWKDATLGTPQSRELFNWIRGGGIPKNSVVAHLCGNSEFLSGYDMDPPLWNKTFHPARGVADPYFVTHPLEITAEAYRVLKNAHVEYVTIGASCFWQDPPRPDQQKAFGTLLGETMNKYMHDSRLMLVRGTPYELLFKLK